MPSNFTIFTRPLLGLAHGSKRIKLSSTTIYKMMQRIKETSEIEQEKWWAIKARSIKSNITAAAVAPASEVKMFNMHVSCTICNKNWIVLLDVEFDFHFLFYFCAVALNGRTCKSMKKTTQNEKLLSSECRNDCCCCCRCFCIDIVESLKNLRFAGN